MSDMGQSTPPTSISDTPESKEQVRYPEAIVSRGGEPGRVDTRFRFARLSRMWLLVVVALLVAVSLIISNWRSRGPVITIEFRDGYGLEPGCKVRLRGIDVGEVEKIILAPDMMHVQTVVALVPEARELAREGTLFWVERAQVSLSNVRGLDTLVGPKYIGVQPAPADARPTSHFVGTESPRQSSETGKIPITIRFRHGHGIRRGAAVRFRGVDVGEVVDVVLSENLRELEVRAELEASAKGLAREGSAFWIERPEFGIVQTRGLDTLVTGAYLAVSPGPESAPYGNEFSGSETAPTEADSVGGIEVILESPEQRGVQPGAPVRYRGIVVGEVLDVGLASDAASVEILLYIEPSYRRLICEGTVFWPTSGFDFQLGLSGLKIDSDPLSSVASGGVSFATSEQSGRPVASGHRFALAEKKLEEWDRWRPQLTVGPQFGQSSRPLPKPIRASFYWKRKKWGVTRSEEHHVWIQPIEGNRILCPLGRSLKMLSTDQFTLEAKGDTQQIAHSRLVMNDDLAAIRDCDLQKLSGHVWPMEQCRMVKKPEDCLLRAGTQSIPVAAARLSGTTAWELDESIVVDEDWNGASVIARADAALIGMLTWRDGEALIVTLTDELLK